MYKEKRPIQPTVWKAESLKSRMLHHLISCKGHMVDDITRMGVRAEEITWQDRKPEEFRVQACSFYNNSHKS